jgi:hypothetical protein
LFWAGVFAASMSVWRVENRFGRVAGRAALSGFIGGCALIAWWAWWPLALGSLLVTLALLAVDQVAGFRFNWEKTAV